MLVLVGVVEVRAARRGGEGAADRGGEADRDLDALPGELTKLVPELIGIERASLLVEQAAAHSPVLVREVVKALSERFEVSEEIADHTPERMIFKLPRELVA